MEQARIDRISELTRISRERALTPEEQHERAELRAEYVAAIRGNLESQLDNTYIVEDDGSKRKVSRTDK